MDKKKKKSEIMSQRTGSVLMDAALTSRQQHLLCLYSGVVVNLHVFYQRQPLVYPLFHNTLVLIL